MSRRRNALYVALPLRCHAAATALNLLTGDKYAGLYAGFDDKQIAALKMNAGLVTTAQNKRNLLDRLKISCTCGTEDSRKGKVGKRVHTHTCLRERARVIITKK